MRTEVTVFILAGGRSSRMGTDKAFLPLVGKTLLEQAILTARQLTESVAFVGERRKLERFGFVVEDVFMGRGPLGGIHAALQSSAVAQLNLMLAVDTPALCVPFLLQLLRIARESGAVVTVPRVQGRFQPLCGVYRPAFLEAAEASLKRDLNKIDPLFSEVSTRILEQDEIRTLGFTSDIFDNVNTPADWERMQQRFREGQ